MNNIALNHRLTLIRGSAVPLHERKERAAKEKERELTFEEKMKNIVVSHVTGSDLSDDNDDNEVKCEDNALEYAIYNTYTAPPKMTTSDDSPVLTSEQIAYLNGKYDFQSMTVYSAELNDFLNDLAAMNIIGEEIKNAPLMLIYVQDGLEKDNSFKGDGTLINSMSLLAATFSDNSAHLKIINILKQLSSSDAAPVENQNNSSLNTSLKWYDHSELNNLCPKEDADEYNRYINDFITETRARKSGMARIHLGPNELPKFMAELQKVKENGGCLTEFLQKYIPEPVKDRTAVNWHNVKLPTQGVDVITLNPETGEIVHAQHFQPLGLRFLSGQGGSFMDREAQNDFVWDLAYDLNKFIQTAFFSEKDSCFDEIDKLLEEIKARQAGKCMVRFN